MKRWINLLTDQRTFADIHKTHHEKYGTDITGYLTRTKKSNQVTNQNKQIPASARESENLNSNIPRLPTV